MSAAAETRRLNFAEDGALHFALALSGGDIERLLAFDQGAAGSRIRGSDLAVALSPATAIASSLIGASARPVRAVLFDKTADRNWALGWHQDRTVAVRQRRETEGFGPWTTKQGILHVAPPMSVLEGMVTLRLHLDPCARDNAPLKIALGSHRLGRVAANDAANCAASLPNHVCLAAAGDIWAYATPILHASDKAARPARRRVLQVDYAGFDLPQGMKWLGLT